MLAAHSGAEHPWLHSWWLQSWDMQMAAEVTVNGWGYSGTEGVVMADNRILKLFGFEETLKIT